MLDSGVARRAVRLHVRRPLAVQVFPHRLKDRRWMGRRHVHRSPAVQRSNCLAAPLVFCATVFPLAGFSYPPTAG